MITEYNLRELLLSLGFTEDGEKYTKQFSDFNAYMSVDFSQRKLIYPNQIRGRERNDTFDFSENFVVFECVNRLLDKGYRPEHIELEKQWHLGHDARGGRADICVEDESGSILFIIECKTWGREFDKALKDTKDDGAQLFSYWQQEQSCKWLILYTSDFDQGIKKYKAPTINCTDDANILLVAERDTSIKIYRNARTVTERYKVWKETYGCTLHDDLVFSCESRAYAIGVLPLLKRDLRDFTPSDKIVNKFEEILRHNNVSDKENAFNRLVALFICKLVDESTKADDNEVEFQYKQGTDTYETLQDRLQRLHHDGMEKFMHEEIYYISADYPEWLFSTYTGSKRKKAIEDLQKTIRILKFYSNNDFAFKDVHNEELFLQNGKILVEMVQLFEKYKIVYSSKYQILGDLFEQLLNKGFKQNEGQFFTPVPITRFIWDSLPVERMVISERGTIYPKIIDYACGAGHFLTEAVEAINFHVQTTSGNAWVKDHIFGIEKDYRLARVAKISLFMNGAGEGNIIFGDGLENAPDAGIKTGTFDILVANPPYSVKDFKQHLQLRNNRFTLLDRIGLDGGEIETLFVERISQLLKPRGIAAVILPSSILSSNRKCYTGARENLLQNFYIRAIVALGSKTFGATGTNTVVMFLEKFNEPPKQFDLSVDSVDAILNGRSLANWDDGVILSNYMTQIDVEENVYTRFIKKSCTLEELTGIEYFNMYVNAFAESIEVKKLQGTRSYENKTDDEKKSIYLEKLYGYMHSIEREKLLYFSLIYQQKTLIITSPTENKAQREFLGYEWSNSKGKEGIQIFAPGGKLYDDNNRAATGTLAYAIKQSFDGVTPTLTDEQREYATVMNTKDMLDFSRVDFSKALKLSARTTINSQYSLKKIEEITSSIETGSRPTGGVAQFNDGAISIGGEHIDTNGRLNLETLRYVPLTFYNNALTGKVIKNDILICKDGAQTGKIAIVRNEFSERNAMINEHVFILRCQNETTQKFLFYFLYSRTGQALLKENITGAAQGGLNSTNLRHIKVPLPPENIQEEIACGCEQVDGEYETTRMSIEEYRGKIEAIFVSSGVVTGEGGGLD